MKRGGGHRGGVSEVRETKTYTNEFDFTWFKIVCDEPSEDEISQCKRYKYCASAVAVNTGKNEQKRLLSYADLMTIYDRD